MTHQANEHATTTSSKAGQQMAQLRHMLVLVEQVAGIAAPDLNDAALDENARISGAYEAASAITRRRFDALTSETETWAAAAVGALVAANDATEQPRPAAKALADELSATLGRLSTILKR